MDSIKHSSFQSLIQSKFSQSENRKQMITFFLSISVFSILVSYSALISFHVKIVIHSFDKNYMFLLCNGLLVFIVKNSGLIGSTHLDDHAVNSVENHSKTKTVVELAERKAAEAHEEVIDVEIEHEEDERLVTLEEEEDERLVTLEEEEDEGCRNSLVMVDYEDHEETGLSTEELNKKCDDFIRKVKAGIKLEVQQSMIMYR